MANDARFEDAYSNPIRLEPLDAEDVQVISTLFQDAIGLGQVI